MPKEKRMKSRKLRAGTKLPDVGVMRLSDRRVGEGFRFFTQ